MDYCEFSLIPPQASARDTQTLCLARMMMMTVDVCLFCVVKVLSCAMDVSEGVMWCSRGPPCCNEYMPYHLFDQDTGDGGDKRIGAEAAL